jgi:hypothetical protein
VKAELSCIEVRIDLGLISAGNLQFDGTYQTLYELIAR